MSKSTFLLLAVVLPAALGQPTYLEALYNLLTPEPRLFDYEIELQFQAAPITIGTGCGEDTVTVSAVNTDVFGIQNEPSQTALAKYDCNAPERNLGTAVYRTEPEVMIVDRTPRSNYGYHSEYGRSEKFCLFMFDAGTDPTPDAFGDATEDQVPFYGRELPYIHWAFCQNQLNGDSNREPLMEYGQVPGGTLVPKRIVFVLFRQPEGNDVDIIPYQQPEVSPSDPDNPYNPRYRFNIRSFIGETGLEVLSVLTLLAAPDIVGMNMLRLIGGFQATGEDLTPFCDRYNELEALDLPRRTATPAIDYGAPCASRGRQFNEQDEQGENEYNTPPTPPMSPHPPKFKPMKIPKFDDLEDWFSKYF